MKRALIYSGGGSRGAYEIGAWQALQDLRIRIDGVYGVSIGAINAALTAQGDADAAVKLWDHIDLSQIVSGADEEGFSVGSMISSKRDIIPFLLEHAKNLRLDVRPLEELIRRSVSEGRVRASGMEVNVTAVRVPSMTPVQLSIRDMRSGSLTDWLMASAACFPVFPLRQIDGMRYIDGGFYDNLPVDRAILDGADELVCVDVHPDFTHPEYAHMPQIRIIKPHSPLGGFLDFSPALLKRSRRLGYLDAMKAYGRYEGGRYAFRCTETLKLSPAAMRYAGEIARFDARCITRMAFIKGNDGIRTPLFSALEADAPGHAMNMKEELLRGLELAARLCGFREDTLYEVDALHARITEMLAAEPVPDVPFSERAVREIAESGGKILLGYIFRRMSAGMQIGDQETRVLAAHPEETAAALCLISLRG